MLACGGVVKLALGFTRVQGGWLQCKGRLLGQAHLGRGHVSLLACAGSRTIPAADPANRDAGIQMTGVLSW